MIKTGKKIWRIRRGDEHLQRQDDGSFIFSGKGKPTTFTKWAAAKAVKLHGGEMECGSSYGEPDVR